jgi:prepilin-type processing-associated H-X9-DG protein
MEYQDPTTRRKGWSCWLTGLLIGCGCAVLMIPILAAILFPVFAKARESARKATCQANLKQISVALRMYSSDYSGRLPSAGNTASDQTFETTLGRTGVAGRAPTWPQAFGKYIQGPKTVYFCPSEAHPAQTISYHYKHAANLAAKAGLVETDFNWPAQQIIFYERQSFHWGGGPIVDGASLNALYLDGHVQTVRMVDVAPDKEPDYFNYLDPSSGKAAKQPYWDPRCCFDKLY